MKSLVIYDSNFGNTKRIAEAIAEELDTTAVSIVHISVEALKNLDLLVVGSPINGWRPSKKMNDFLANVPDGKLMHVKATAFDTRVKLFIHGDAAGKIAHVLEKAGATIISKPQGFLVKGNEGPLLDGEIAKAKTWANTVKQKINE